MTKNPAPFGPRLRRAPITLSVELVPLEVLENDACAKAFNLDVVDVSLIARVAERGGAGEV